MAKIANLEGRKYKISDFTPVREAAEKIGVTASTLKRWLKKEEVDGIIWGRDKRGWIFVKTDQISLLKDHKESVIRPIKK